jgi:hypothetical protein
MEIIMEQIIKDAMRYRWLRDTNNLRTLDDEEGDFVVGNVEAIMVGEDHKFASGPIGKDFDDAIDLAILFQKLDRETYDNTLPTA